MSLTQHNLSKNVDIEVLEKVILHNDLSSFSTIEKVQYITGLCKSLGLNPATKPIQIMKFQGKEIPYFTKDSSEQLRKINNISIVDMKNQIIDGSLYIVTTTAKTPDGRQDSSTGVISIVGLKGEALANAMMKAETKSKRRVTLSICGLGFIDESEVDSIQGAVKIDLSEQNKKVGYLSIEATENLEQYYEQFLVSIKKCSSIEELQNIFSAIKKANFDSNDKLFKSLIDEKDKRKLELLHMNDELAH